MSRKIRPRIHYDEETSTIARILRTVELDERRSTAWKDRVRQLGADLVRALNEPPPEPSGARSPEPGARSPP